MSFSELVDRLPREPYAKGRMFERLCRWYLQNAPEYRLRVRKVWLWDEWPGRWGPVAVSPGTSARFPVNQARPQCLCSRNHYIHWSRAVVVAPTLHATGRGNRARVAQSGADREYAAAQPDHVYGNGAACVDFRRVGFCASLRAGGGAIPQLTEAVPPPALGSMTGRSSRARARRARRCSARAEPAMAGRSGALPCVIVSQLPSGRNCHQTMGGVRCLSRFQR